MTPRARRPAVTSGDIRAHVPGGPFPPGGPSSPGRPRWPGEPGRPGEPGWPGEQDWPIDPGRPSGPPPEQVPVPPVRVWQDPHADWQGKLYEQLLKKRIVLAAGLLDDDAATRLSAQLLTLEAEKAEPIRLELQNLRAELPATLTVMGILDVMRAPVHACVSGEIAGPALGVLVSCPRRSGYPNAAFTLTEPKLSFGGTVTAISAREQQVTRMLDTLYFRLAEVTGREVDEIREDARRGRSLTTAQAIGYGLIQSLETSARPGGPPVGPGRPPVEPGDPRP
jgi:ATP-dependent Clp protease protease subunit